MRISKINFTPQVYLTNNGNIKKDVDSNINNNSNIRFAYRDFNISFGERLFRTPANFYAQPFNKKNMPYSMQQYLNADYEDRQNVPPAQMMKIVFDDLNEINNLDFVKRVYKEEPLFKDLTDVPNRKAKKGIISEVEAMKSEMAYAPLFKDGSSNFGMYLLKKIYLEGKTLNEINKDFKRDLSDTYEGLITSEIDYNTLPAYGIKFPKAPFWKSFIATREDFPYVYKPRKIDSSRLGNKRERTLSDIMSGNAETVMPKRPPRFKVKNDFEAKRMGDALLKGHGSVKETEKSLKHKGIIDKDEISFVSKYLSEIMSVALEKTHASEEMRSYFESYDSMNKRQKEKMEGYWKSNPYMRDLQSLAISDTIKLFFDTYGPDGNNDEFRELVNYARNIKPLRDEKLAEHVRKQQYYDEIAEELALADSKNEVSSESPVEKIITEEEMKLMLEKEAIKNGATLYTFVSPEGEEFRIVLNLDECIEERFKYEYSLMPKALISKFARYSKKSSYATTEYKKSVAMLSKVPEFVEKELLPLEECHEISKKINEEFCKKNSKLVVAGEQAFAEQIINRFNGRYSGLLGAKAFEIDKFAREQLKITEWTPEERQSLEQNYKEYITPITSKSDIKKIQNIFLNTISMPPSKDYADIPPMDETEALLLANIMKYPEVKKELYKYIKDSNFIENYGGSTKILLKSDISDELKYRKCSLMKEDFIAENIDLVVDILSMDFLNIDKYIKNPDIKDTLMQHYFMKSINHLP